MKNPQAFERAMSDKFLELAETAEKYGVPFSELLGYFQQFIDLLEHHREHPRGDGALRSDGTRHVSTPINDARLTLSMTRLLDFGRF